MNVQNVSNKSISKSVGVGVAVGACAGLPSLVSNISGIVKLEKLHAASLKNAALGKSIADTFNAMAKKGVVISSPETAEMVAGVFKDFAKNQKILDSISGALDDTYKTLNKAYKSGMKNALIASGVGAAVCGTAIAIINKVKQNKENIEKN